MHDERVVRWTLLDLKNALHGRDIKGIRSQAIDRFGRNGHELPRTQCIGGAAHRIVPKANAVCRENHRLHL